MNARGGAIALGLGALMLPTLAGCGHRGAEATVAASTAPKIVIVDVAPVERRAVDRTVDVVGELKGWDDGTIGARREGRVVKIRYDMGDRVAPGALLVELETTDAQLAVEQAERHLQVDLAKLGLTEPPKANFDIGTIPSVVQAKVALDRAKQNLARERSLQQRNAGAYQDFQNAENDERSSEAALGTAILNARSALASAQSTKVAIDIAMHDL